MGVCGGGLKWCTPVDVLLQFLLLNYTVLALLKVVGHEGVLEQVPACSGSGANGCKAVYAVIWCVFAIMTWLAWIRDKTPPREDGSYVKISIIEARGLAKRDIASESDPFAYAELCADPNRLPYARSINSHHHNEFKTPVVMDEPNPTWKTDITFKTSRDATNLVVTVWDKDWLDTCWRSMPRHITKCPCVLSPRTNGTNDWLGSVVIPIGEMNASNGEERWYPLARDSAHVKNEYGQKGKDPQGEIKIKCQFLNTDGNPTDFFTNFNPLSQVSEHNTKVHSSTLKEG